MRHLITTILLLAVTTVVAQESDPFAPITKRLDKHFNLHPGENLFVQTDRDVYRAGDVVWFSGFAVSPSAPGLGSVSDNLVVCLYDGNGTKLNEDKYKMAGGLCRGDFDLPAELNPGRYVLVAYSGATQEGNELFMRSVYVDAFNSNARYVQPLEVPAMLVPGANNELLFALTEMDGKAFGGKVNWELKSGDRQLASGKEKAGEKGLLRLVIAVPDQPGDEPLHLVIGEGTNAVYSGWLATESQKVTVAFQVEGGHYVAGANQKMTFTVADSWGRPVVADVALIDKADGRVVLNGRTLSPGFGMFPLTGDDSRRLALRITAGPGKGQQFDLPAPQPDGLALAVTRLDNDFVYCTLNWKGTEKKELLLAAFRGSRLVWGTPVTIDKALSLKIPKAELEQGLCQFAAFDSEMNLQASRLLYVEKGQAVDLNTTVSPNPVGTEVPALLKTGIAGENGGGCLISYSVTPDQLIAPASPDFENWLGVNGWLNEPVLADSRPAGSEAPGEWAINLLVSGRQLKNFDWTKARSSLKMRAEAEGISRARLEEQIPRAVTAYLQRTWDAPAPQLSPNFCQNNPTLFRKVKVVREGVEKGKSYLSYLASGSAILEVIKMIKPFTMQGDKIIFPGGNNSFLAQDGALIVVDGQKLGTSASVLASISPYDVESIDVSTRPIDIQQYTGFNSVGLIDIKTKRGERPVVKDQSPMKEYSEGNRVPRDFSQLVVEGKQNPGGTLLWEPAKFIEPSATQTLPVAKVKAGYTVRVCALDDAGNLGSGTAAFDVK